MNKTLLIKFFFNHFEKNKSFLILLIFSSIFCALSEGIGVFLIFPLLMPDQAIQNFANVEMLQNIIMNFSNYSAEFKIYMVSLTIIFLILIRFIFLLIVNFISVYLPLKIESKMISQYYEKILLSDYEFINSKKRGFLISNTFEHPAKSSSIIFNGSQIILNIFLVIIYFLILLLASYKITMIALLIIFSLFFFVRKISTKPITEYGKIKTIARYRLYDFFTSSISVY
jgi:ABC-type multidrug transport system, ATPase and permease components